MSQNRKNEYAQICSTIQAMIKQEQSAYIIPDYLESLPATTDLGHPVDSEARLLIARWCLQLATVCEYNRETAAIAMTCLDRFVSTDEGYDVLLDRTQFQKAALTSLYMAVKIHEEKALSPDVIAKLSRGKHSVKDIEEMEVQILTALKWRVNPPTAMSFVRTFLELFPESGLDDGMRTVIMEIIECQVEFTVISYDFCRDEVSLVAFASLLNAIESVYGDGVLFTKFHSLVSRVTNIDGQTLAEIRNRLYDTIPKDKFAEHMSMQKRRFSSCGTAYSKGAETQLYSESPRCVKEEMI